MWFKRADLPGIALAGFAPAALYLLVVAAFDLWHHEGTPLLSALAIVIALGAGITLGALARFVRRWRIVGGLVAAISFDVAGVLVLQRTGQDGTVLATTLKLGGAGLFLAANAVIAYDVIDWGLLPIIDRRAARRATHRAERA